MQSDGNLVIYDQLGSAYWIANTYGSQNVMALQVMTFLDLKPVNSVEFGV